MKSLHRVWKTDGKVAVWLEGQKIPSLCNSVYQNQKSNLSLYSLYYAEACNELAGLHLRVIAPGQHSFFRRNVAAVASCWQHCVRFDRLKIWTSKLPPQKRTWYRLTNWPVNLVCKDAITITVVYTFYFNFTPLLIIAWYQKNKLVVVHSLRNEIYLSFCPK